MSRIISSLAVIALSAALAFGQESLTNDGIVKLVKSGMSEDLIVNLIARQPTAFALGANDLVSLKSSGVSERVITAMINKTSSPSAPAAATAAPPAPAPPKDPLAALRDPGIYYKKNNAYLELLTEDINWTTSGAMKSIASAGFIKKDLRGNITGPSSRNFLQSPLEIIIVPPQGLSINDYAVLPLKPEKGVREFTVGAVNRKNGVTKGALPMGVERVAPSAFRIVFQTQPGPGEYGILITKAMGSAEGSKMFTFRLLI